jgi:hypothetical protein
MSAEAKTVEKTGPLRCSRNGVLGLRHQGRSVRVLTYSHCSPLHIASLVAASNYIWATRDRRSIVYQLVPYFCSLKGAVQGRMIQHSSRSFALEVTLDLFKGAEFFCHKPALHLNVQEK